MEQICGIRTLDVHGRINIPIDIRRDMGLKDNKSERVGLYYDKKNKIFSVKPLSSEKQFLDQINFLKDLSDCLDKSKKEKILKLIENIKNIFIEGDGL